MKYFITNQCTSDLQQHKQIRINFHDCNFLILFLHQTMKHELLCTIYGMLKNEDFFFFFLRSQICISQEFHPIAETNLNHKTKIILQFLHKMKSIFKFTEGIYST